jgi:hypothetical protein
MMTRMTCFRKMQRAGQGFASQTEESRSLYTHVRPFWPLLYTELAQELIECPHDRADYQDIRHKQGYGEESIRYCQSDHIRSAASVLFGSGLASVAYLGHSKQTYTHVLRDIHRRSTCAWYSEARCLRSCWAGCEAVAQVEWS